jgi:hypothetical protein
MDDSLSPASGRLRPPFVALLRYLPGLILGVFLARLTGEYFGLPGIWAAVGLSLALGAVFAWLLARWPLERTWSTLILIVYIILPEANPTLAWRIAAIALIAYFLHWLTPIGRLAAGRRAVALITILLTIGAFFLYYTTLAPDVLPADSGELQVVAAQLGVAHPPGFPLYVMVAHLFTRVLASVEPAFAVNLFSAVTGALTVGVVYLTGIALTRRHLPSLVAAFALATATTFWSQSTTANVRSLTGLFAALIIYALVRFRAAVADKDQSRADRWLIVAALGMGFGLTHHVSLVFLIAVGLVFVAWVDPSLLRAPRRWLRPIAAGLLGLLPLLYLPLRATADVRGASPALATASGFLEHILATGFRGDLFYFVSPADLWQRLLIMGNVMILQFALAVLATMLIGLLLLIRRDRPLAWLLGGTFAVYTLVAATYRAPQTVEYMLPAYVAAAVAVAPALAWLPDELARFGWPGRAVAATVAALVVVGALGQLTDNWTASGSEHEGTAARDYAGGLLAEAPADSVILAHWHWATPLWYLQEIEGRRPDVAVRFVFPEGEAYEATWARRTAEEWAAGRPVITTWVPVTPLADLPVPEPIGEAILYPLAPRETLPQGFTSTSLTLDNAIAVSGYRVEQPVGSSFVPGDEAVITVAWRPLVDLSPEQQLFVHLVGEDGVIYGQDDRPATAAEGITLTQFRVTPRPGTPIGTLTVAIGAAEDRQNLTEIDIDRTYERPFTRNPVMRTPLDPTYDTLIGYDWDHTLEGRERLYLHWAGDFLDGYWTQVVDDEAIAALDLLPYRGPWGIPVKDWEFPGDRESGHYVPLGEGIVWTGETVNGLSLSPGQATVVDAELHSSRPINRDYVVSLRLIGLEPDGVHWAWWDLNDSIPAMGAIPTLKWIDGSLVRSPHRVTVAADAPPGQALTGALTLYDAFTNRPLPILDERMTAANPWIPLCQAIVE